jgi:hypothetical protein
MNIRNGPPRPCAYAKFAQCRAPTATRWPPDAKSSCSFQTPPARSLPIPTISCSTAPCFRPPKPLTVFHRGRAWTFFKSRHRSARRRQAQLPAKPITCRRAQISGIPLRALGTPNQVLKHTQSLCSQHHLHRIPMSLSLHPRDSRPRLNLNCIAIPRDHKPCTVRLSDRCMLVRTPCCHCTCLLISNSLKGARKRPWLQIYPSHWTCPIQLQQRPLRWDRQMHVPCRTNRPPRLSVLSKECLVVQGDRCTQRLAIRLRIRVWMP